MTFFPIRTGLARVPLFIKLPGQKQMQRIDRIAQPWDLAPTVMDLHGFPIPDEFQGQSLLPVIEGKSAAPRPYGFNGSNQQATYQRQAINQDYIYVTWPNGEREDWLVDLKNDPAQEKNVAAEHPDVCREMRAALVEFDPAPFGAA